MAEVYHIYDYRQLPASQVAVFAKGLGDDSRIMKAMTGQKMGLERLLLAGIFDRLGLLVWAKSKDGQRGTNRPASLMETLLNKQVERQELVFASGEDFEAARRALMEGVDDGN